MPKHKKKEKPEEEEEQSGFRARVAGFFSTAKKTVTEQFFAAEDFFDQQVKDDGTLSDPVISSDDEDTLSDISISALPDPTELLEQRKSHLYWTDEILKGGKHYQGTKTVVEQQKEGSGVFETPTQIYSGQWKEDGEHGYGCQVSHSAADDRSAPRQFGRWVNGQLIEGYVVDRRNSGKQEIDTITYQGPWRTGKRDGLGELIICLSSRERYSIVARWRDNKISQIFENGISLAESEILVDLSQWIVGKSASDNKRILFLLSQALESDNSTDLSRLIQKLPKDCDEIFKKKLKKLLQFHLTLDVIKVYFNNSADCAKSKVVDVLRKQLIMVKKNFRRGLFKAVKNPVFNFSQAHPNIKETIDCIYESIDSFNEEIVFFAKGEHIHFFLEMLNWLQLTSSQFKKDFREIFIKQYTSYVKEKWEEYAKEINRKKSRFNEEIQDNANCLLSLFKLETVLLKHLHQLAGKNVLKQEEGSLLLEESELPDVSGVKLLQYYYNTILQFFDNYDLWYRPRAKRGPQNIIFQWVGTTLDDFDATNRKYCSAEMHKQVWLHLNYFSQKISLEVEQKETVAMFFLLEENFIQLIKKSQPMFESWREILQLLLQYKLFALGSEETCNQDLLNKKIEGLTRIKEITLFSSILGVYLTHYQEESRSMKKFSSLGFSEELDSFKQFKQAYYALVESALNQQSSEKVNHHFFVQLNDFLLQIQDLDYTWLIDDKVHQKLGRVESESEKRLFHSPSLNKLLAPEFRVQVAEEANDGITKVNTTTNMRNISSAAKFKQQFADKFGSTPHYVFDFLYEVINLISKVNFSEQQTEGDILIGAYAQLMKTAVQLFTYFAQQQATLADSNECDLSAFVNKMVAPMQHIISENKTLQDLIRKCGLIERYILFTQRIAQIDLDSAIKQFKARKTKLSGKEEEWLKHCFQVCQEKFSELLNRYIETDGQQERKEKKESIINETCNLAKEPGKPLISWTYKQRRILLPQVLAGVSVILSLQESGFLKEFKAHTAHGYFLQPHCIQVLGVLRLLAVDSEGDMSSHLGEILTGQGKSWVLGLTAVVIALTGHEVKTVCYSETLTKRDGENLDSLFQVFGVRREITYCTLEKLSSHAVALSKSRYNSYDIYDLVKLLLKNERKKLTLRLPDPSNTVLLVDEVDVLFSLLGESCRFAVNDVREDFAQFQRRIWHEMKDGTLDKEQHRPDVDFIEGDSLLSRHPQMKYQVNRMLDTASKCKNDEEYRLNPKTGNVERLTSEERYRENSYIGYYNSFHYLRLCDQAHREYGHAKAHRYGYLLVSCGIFSYVELAKQYPLILGVSGSLKQLADGEERVLKSFNIEKKSYYPTFFGKSLIKFDPLKKAHFRLIEKSADWTGLIIQQAQMMVEAGRSVLVFFKTHGKLKEFYEQHARAQLGRVCLVEPETDFSEKEDIVNRESGLPKTVTLLTRSYGRGEDFKASAAVNKNGGIHIIQTFLSPDPKEEIQIKGRTARKNDPGSYSLILHLDQVNKLLGTEVATTTSFKQLSDWRKEKFQEDFESKSKEAKEIEESHTMTIKLRDNLYQFFTGDEDVTREELLDQLHRLATR